MEAAAPIIRAEPDGRHEMAPLQEQGRRISFRSGLSLIENFSFT